MNLNKDLYVLADTLKYLASDLFFLK